MGPKAEDKLVSFQTLTQSIPAWTPAKILIFSGAQSWKINYVLFKFGESVQTSPPYLIFQGGAQSWRSIHVSLQILSK